MCAGTDGQRSVAPSLTFFSLFVSRQKGNNKLRRQSEMIAVASQRFNNYSFWHCPKKNQKSLVPPEAPPAGRATAQRSLRTFRIIHYDGKPSPFCMYQNIKLVFPIPSAAMRRYCRRCIPLISHYSNKPPELTRNKALKSTQSDQRS